MLKLFSCCGGSNLTQALRQAIIPSVIATFLLFLASLAHAEVMPAGTQAFEDPTRQMTFEQVQATPRSSWRELRDRVPAFGYTASAWWLRFDLPSTGPHESPYTFMEVKFLLLDEVD